MQVPVHLCFKERPHVHTNTACKVSHRRPQDIDWAARSEWADPASAAATLEAPFPTEIDPVALPDDHPERVGACLPWHAFSKSLPSVQHSARLCVCTAVNMCMRTRPCGRACRRASRTATVHWCCPRVTPHVACWCARVLCRCACAPAPTHKHVHCETLPAY